MHSEAIDGLDSDAYHVCIWEDGKLLAYCRVVYGYVAGEVSVGRVITLRRGAGLGKIVVEKGIDMLKKHHLNGIFKDYDRLADWKDEAICRWWRELEYGATVLGGKYYEDLVFEDEEEN